MRRLRGAVLGIVLLAAIVLGQAHAGGMVYFYVDKDNSGSWGAGDILATFASVYYTRWSSVGNWEIGMPSASNTSIIGGIYIPKAHAGDTLFARYKVYSQPAAKSDRGFAGSMFDLWMTTDSMLANGDVAARKLSQAEATQINGGYTVMIALNHPVFEWNLVMALNWNASPQYINQLQAGCRTASNYLFDVTDGYMKLGRIDIRNNTSQTSDLWKKYCDARIDLSDAAEYTDSLGVVEQAQWGAIHMGKTHAMSPKPWDAPDGGVWPQTLIHELGHYALDFGDEYRNGKYQMHEWGAYRKAHIDQVPTNYGLMDSQGTCSEMSASRDYMQSYYDFQDWQMTSQIWHTYRSIGGFHRPCWEYMFDRFGNSIGNQTKWNGYNGFRFGIVLPPYSYYRGTICGFVPMVCFEFRDPPRDGPVNSFPRNYGWFFDIWKQCEFQGASANAPASQPYLADPSEVGLTVLSPAGTPVRGARVWCETPGGRRIEQGRTDRNGRLTCCGAKGDRIRAACDLGVAEAVVEGTTGTVRFSQAKAAGPEPQPRATITASLSRGDYGKQLTVYLYTSEALSDLPTADIRAGFGDPITVSLTQVLPRTYTGAASIGDCISGSIEIWPHRRGETPLGTTTFRVATLTPLSPVTIYSPDGVLEANVPDGILSAPTSAISLGAGNAPVMPTDPTLVLLSEPQSFAMQDNFGFSVDHTLNWRLNPELLAGFDAATVQVQRYATPEDANEPFWMPVSSSFTPGGSIITASARPGVFGVFARTSTDVTPPGQITNLTARTGLEGAGIGLNWTALGDDAAAGRATRYRLWFSTSPIDQGNLDLCAELPLDAQPQSSGEPEAFGVNMPDCGTTYYLAVQAEDEAGNRGPLSNVVRAASYQKDSDGDGLGDLWELSYGLDPHIPGDANLDSDDDGLTNLQERNLHTDPSNPDTDGDGLSDGLEVNAGTSPTDPTVPKTAQGGSIKQYPDDTTVGCPYLVTTADFGAEWYAQSPDRAWGIRTVNPFIATDRVCEAIGYLDTAPNGERQVWVSASRARFAGSAGPLAMRCTALGGSSWHYDSLSSAGQMGIAGGIGLNNLGLLVRIAGQVTEIEQPDPPAQPTWFKIKDGSVEVKCLVPSGVTIDPAWQRVTVTGISSCELANRQIVRLLRVRTREDIQSFP